MVRPRRRQRVWAAAAAALFLAACGGPQPEVGSVGAVGGFLGGIVAEEPHAAVVARDVLSAGGTAADAATAAYFTLAVTYPVGAGLGGGGACVYYDAEANTAEALEFLPAVPRNGGPVLVPGSLRGFALLHSRYGQLRWTQLVSPAETLARFGFGASRALARRVAANRDRLMALPGLREQFIGVDGEPLGEGERLIRVQVAAMLSRVRTRGVGDFYGGEAGQWFVEDSGAVGGTVSVADLRAYRARLGPTVDRQYGNHLLHHPSANGGGGLMYDLTDLSNDPAVLPAGSKLGGEFGDAGFVIGDRTGSAVACSLTMGAPFGSGQVARTTGLLLADPAARSFTASAVVGANHNTDQAFFAAAAGGGAAGVSAVAKLARDLLIDEGDLQAALNQPRSYRVDGSSVGETGQGDASLGRVQALWCPQGLFRRPDFCQFASDPRGFGLAAGEIR